MEFPKAIIRFLYTLLYILSPLGGLTGLVISETKGYYQYPWGETCVVASGLGFGEQTLEKLHLTTILSGVYRGGPKIRDAFLVPPTIRIVEGCGLLSPAPSR